MNKHMQRLLFEVCWVVSVGLLVILLAGFAASLGGCKSSNYTGDGPAYSKPLIDSAGRIVVGTQKIDDRADEIIDSTQEPETKASAEIIKSESEDIRQEAEGQREIAAQIDQLQADRDTALNRVTELESEHAKHMQWLYVGLAGLGGVMLVGGIVLAVAAGSVKAGGLLAVSGLAVIASALFLQKYEEWIAVGFGVALVVGLGVASYYVWINRRAVKEVVRSVEVSGAKESVKVAAKALASKSTQQIIREVKQ